jgi:predicted nicotinamide N-methyase
MRYPLKLIPVFDNLSIYIPDYEQVKETYELLLKENPDELFPFWAKLWPSSLALVKVLKQCPDLVKNKIVLELGAGIGLPSFIMSGHTQSIIVSDYNEDAVALLNKNIAKLQLQHIQALQLDWNDLPKTIQPEVVVLSDVNYDPTQFEKLNELIHTKIKDGCTIILATPQRITASPFVATIAQYVKERFEEVVHENGIAKEISILVLSL